METENPIDEMEFGIPIDEYKKIGQGGEASVYEGKFSGIKLAIKILPIMPTSNYHLLELEQISDLK